MAPSEEIVDIVDRKDIVIESMPHHLVRQKKPRAFLRQTRVLVFNSKRQLLMQRRSATDERNPGMWSASACGQNKSKETYRECAARELQEETGLRVPASELLFLFKQILIDKDKRCHEQVFTCEISESQEKELNAHHGEVMELAWTDTSTIDSLLHKNSPTLTPGFRKTWKTYRRMQGLLPSPEQCIAILEENNGTPTVIAHCKKVRDVALRISHALVQKGIPVNMPLVEAAALLHDLMKLKAQSHEEAAARALRNAGFTLLAETVRSHGLYKIEHHPPKTIEQKIIFYADKRVDFDRVVSVEERFAELAKRYPNADSPHREIEYAFTQEIGQELKVTF